MKNTAKLFVMSGLVAICAFCIGCAGARGKIRLEELNHPVSMSPYLYGKNGQLLSIDKGLTYAGGLFVQKKYFGTFYTVIRLTGDGDLSKQIDDAITAVNGDGIVNFHYVVDQGGTNACIPLTWLPIWPGTANVVFFGDIVKVKGGGK
jgi:hypothetical protein